MKLLQLGLTVSDDRGSI